MLYHKHTCARIYTHTYTHAHKHTCTHTHACTHTDRHTHTQSHVDIHTPTHTCTYTHNTYMHLRTTGCYISDGTVQSSSGLLCTLPNRLLFCSQKVIHVHTQYTAYQDQRLLHHKWYMHSFLPLDHLAHCLWPSVIIVEWSVTPKSVQPDQFWQPKLVPPLPILVPPVKCKFAIIQLAEYSTFHIVIND